MASFSSSLLLVFALIHADSAASRVIGRVVMPGGDSVIAVPHRWVTLHRVGSDHAGPIDSTHTDGRGQFTIDYQRTGDSTAIYFVSSSFGGVAYFTPPLHEGVTRGDDAVITVFDTTSRPVPMTVRGEHLVIGSLSPDGTRAVTEVFEVSNDSSVTRVARDDTPSGAAWSVLLPSGARSPRVVESDISAAAVRFAAGRVLVYSPLAPGLKQLAFTYALPASAFPLAFPIERNATGLEVLLEEKGAHATGAGLRQVQSVAVDGRDFDRYQAADVPARSVATITVPDPPASIGLGYVAALVLVVGGAMTAALALALRRR